MSDEQRDGMETGLLQGGHIVKPKNRKRKLPRRDAPKPGVCYLSRIPPQMDPWDLRRILTPYGEINRVYLNPQDDIAQVKRKQAGGSRKQQYSEGWIEFNKKSVAKRVSQMLNGQQIGGKKRSPFYYDIWNIKYLSKFKWDNLTEETAHKNAIREQKLAMELSAAKRERDFYLAKVDQSLALNSIEERLKKKQKVHQESAGTSDTPATKFVHKVTRQYRQIKPVSDNAEQRRPRLSRDVLAGIFGGAGPAES